LHAEWQLSDLVEEHRAAGSELKLALTPIARAGECAALVAKQFVLDQGLGNCRAVDGDERLVAPRGKVMYSTCEELFAGA